MTLATALHAMASMCVTGTLMQTFLAVIDFDSSLIYIHSTVAQAVSLATIMLGARYSERGNVLRRDVICTLPMIALILLHIPFAIVRSASIRALFCFF